MKCEVLSGGAAGGAGGVERRCGEAARVQIGEIFPERRDKVCFGFKVRSECDNNQILKDNKIKV